MLEGLPAHSIITKRRKVALIGLHKLAMIAECKQPESECASWRMADISSWTEIKFSLPHPPHIATVSRRLCGKDKIVESVKAAAGSRKRKLMLQCEPLENAR